MDAEEWKFIPGYEDLYQVSSLGRVRSVPRFDGKGARIKGRYLKPVGYPYLHVDLWKGGKGHSKMIHRLVAEAFIPNPDNLPEIDHYDGVKTNNCVSNLCWVSPRENTLRKVANSSRKSYATPVKCLETGQVFTSISSAGRFVHTDATRIVESIATKSCCKGYTFVYADFDGDEKSYVDHARSKYQDYHRRPDMKNSRKVRCVETEQVFMSIAEAARVYGCDTATITNRIAAERPFGGVTLKYVEEDGSRNIS